MDPNFDSGLLHKGTCVTPIHFVILNITMNIIDKQKLGINTLQVLSQFGYPLKNWAVSSGQNKDSFNSQGIWNRG